MSYNVKKGKRRKGLNGAQASSLWGNQASRLVSPSKQAGCLRHV